MILPQLLMGGNDAVIHPTQREADGMYKDNQSTLEIAGVGEGRGWILLPFPRTQLVRHLNSVLVIAGRSQ